MATKKCNYGWCKGKKVFRGEYGTKVGYAHDLILMGDIQLSKKDWRTLAIRNSTNRELERVQYHEWAKFLETKGWEWKKL